MMYIGKVAELTGASRKAIRLYESMGLIPAPKRKGQYRIYSDEDVFVIHMIKHAQSLGFKLTELKELIAKKTSSTKFPTGVAIKLIDQRREKLQQEIVRIHKLDQELEDLQHQIIKAFGQD
jgi:DNA-binding transcriptional MerR regulator